MNAMPTVQSNDEPDGRYMTLGEARLNAVLDAVPAGVLVIAHVDADGEYRAVTVTTVRI